MEVDALITTDILVNNSHKATCYQWAFVVKWQTILQTILLSFHHIIMIAVWRHRDHTVVRASQLRSFRKWHRLHPCESETRQYIEVRIGIWFVEVNYTHRPTTILMATTIRKVLFLFLSTSLQQKSTCNTTSRQYFKSS